ncbi:MAG: AMP-binding protein [Caulobacteraceae bacterium]|nr:AMP-binding protein [Caulobacter sp.]
MTLPVAGRLPPSLDEIRRRLTAPGAPFEMETVVIRGVETRVWKHAPLSLREVLAAARGYGGRDMLVYAGERASYDAFHRAVAALAADFAERGLRKGDRVALVMRNLPEWPVAYFACVALGGIVTPLNAWGAADEIAYGLDDCGARFAVVDAERYDLLAPGLDARAALEHVYVARPQAALEPGEARPLAAVIGARAEDWARLPDADLPEAELAPEDLACIYYTSGTTGRPKGAYATHRAVLTNPPAIAYAAARTILRGGGELPPPGPAPARTALVGLPLFHVTGCNVILVTNILAGAKLVIMRKWDVERAFQLIEAERVTNAGGVPALAWQLLEDPRRGDYDLSSLERVNWGGAPASPELEGGLRAAFPGVAVSTGWGMTELSGVHTDIAGADLMARPTSCGAPVGDYGLKACDAEGRELPAGEIGELWASGPNVAVGYWNRPEATAETFVDGWVRTGDVGYLDAEGFCFIVDRKKDMLIRGGENIYCIEVEAALYQHPAVLDAAVFGVAHRTLGEEPAAAVTLRPGHAVYEASLRAFVRERIAGFKVPVRIALTADPLPRNASGKILKPACRAMLEV